LVLVTAFLTSWPRTTPPAVQRRVNVEVEASGIVHNALYYSRILASRHLGETTPFHQR
jgi:hypothetical protein